jgi:hypothetical protein
MEEVGRKLYFPKRLRLVGKPKHSEQRLERRIFNVGNPSGHVVKVLVSVGCAVAIEGEQRSRPHKSDIDSEPVFAQATN